MSTLDLSILLTGSERNALIGAGPTPLRIVLLPGEVLRMPRSRASLRVLSGAAWMTRAGMDMVLSAGEQTTVPASRDAAVISGLGALPLMVEVL
jgi:hypothetical protein